MSYFPLDRDLLTSSTWATGTPEQIKVWIFMMLEANPRTGIVTDTAPAIALRCGLSLAVVSDALAWLAAPDPHSRTKAHEGRRIEAVEGGWRLLTYLARRDRDHSTPRVQRFRARLAAAAETACNGVSSVSETLETTNTNTNTTSTDLSPGGDVATVFQHWKQVMGRTAAKLTLKRAQLIKARLRDSTVDELLMAVDGCAASAWHMGRNDRRTRFDDLTLICRDREHVERFLELAAVGTAADSEPEPFDAFKRAGLA